MPAADARSKEGGREGDSNYSSCNESDSGWLSCVHQNDRPTHPVEVRSNVVTTLSLQPPPPHFPPSPPSPFFANQRARPTAVAPVLASYAAVAAAASDDGDDTIVTLAPCCFLPIHHRSRRAAGLAASPAASGLGLGRHCTAAAANEAPDCDKGFSPPRAAAGDDNGAGW